MRSRVAFAALVVGLLGGPASGAYGAPLSLGSGGLPDVTVESDGTADIVWNGSEALNPSLHFCRVPRGGSACAQSATLSPGGGSVTRPGVFVEGTTIRIVSYRYGLPQNRDLLYTSTDGGSSFGAPEEIGDLSPGEITALGGGRFAAITSSVSPTQAQVMTAGGGVPSTDASLGTSYLYTGSIAAAGSTLVAVSTSSDETTVGFATSSSGDPNASASWSAFQAVGAGLRGQLAQGPAGLFLLVGRTAVGEPDLSVRAWNGSGFGAPVTIPGAVSADVPSAAFTEDSGGVLHAFWHQGGLGTLYQSSSADAGGSWSAPEAIVSGQTTYDNLRASAAGDHGGVAAWTAGGSVYSSFIAPPGPAQPSPGSGLTYVPARAALSLRSAGVAGRRPLVLDASASRVPGSSIVAFRWDINGDGKVDATCGGQAASIEVPLRSTGSATATVSVVDSSGAITKAAIPVSVVSSSKRGIGAAGSIAFPSSQAYICRSGPAAADVTGDGGPPSGCGDEITYGVVDAIGCFTAVAKSHPIPAREQQIIYDEVLGISTRSPGGARLSALAGNLTPAQQVSIARQDTQIATTTVRVNGLDITPAPGSALVFLPANKYLVSSFATVRDGPITLQTGRLVAKLPYAPAGVKLTGFDTSRPVPLPGVALPLLGHVDVILRPDGSADLPIHVGLPSVFRDPLTGKGLTGDATLHTDNVHGWGRLTTLDVNAPDIWLGGIELHNMYFHYSAATGDEIGGGDVIFPPSGDRIHGDLGFHNGIFNKLRLDWYAGVGTGVAVGPGVFLTHVGGGFTINPTELDGDVTVAAGTSIGEGCPAVGVAGHLHLHFAPGPVSLDATGSGELVCIPLANVFFHIDGGGFLTFGGGVNISLGPLSLNANIAAQFLYPHFQFDGDAHGCVDGLGCIGGEAVLSDRGIGFCADFGFTHAGAGVHFAGVVPNILSIISHTTIMFDSCDIAQFRSLPKAATAALAPGSSEFKVPSGEKVAVLGILGNGTAPQVTVTGPDGRVLHSAAPGAPVRNADEVIFTSPSSRTSYMLINHPRPGRWTVTPDPGSPAIAEVQTSHTLPAVRIAAQVTRRRSSRVLRYRIAPAPGQQVQFVEEAGTAAQPIGRARGGKGIIRFTPLDVSATSRRIVAVVTQDGRPRSTVTVARYRGGPPSIGRPAKLRATRHGTTLLIRWAGTALAEGYRISIRLSDGRALSYAVSAGRRSLTVRGVSPRTTGTILLAGSRSANRLGPRARVKLRRGH